eukprot:symbB.v1.2.032934.t2/scaffold4026.1/size46687/2
MAHVYTSLPSPAVGLVWEVDCGDHWLPYLPATVRALQKELRGKVGKAVKKPGRQRDQKGPKEKRLLFVYGLSQQSKAWAGPTLWQIPNIMHAMASCIVRGFFRPVFQPVATGNACSRFFAEMAATPRLSKEAESALGSIKATMQAQKKVTQINLSKAEMKNFPGHIRRVNASIEGKASLQDVDQALQDSSKAPQLDTLMAAVKAQNVPLVQLLLQRKADVNGQDEKGVSALHLAVFDGRLQLVRQLLNAQADPNLRDCHGQSPIFFAPTRQVCELLMFRKADLVSSNSKKQTPLHLAAHAGLHEAAACLLETFQSSALELEDISGHSPLLYAAKSKVKSIHAFLQGLRTEGKLEEATHYPADDGEKQQIAVPPVDLEKTQGEKMKETLQTPQTKCPEGHDLVPFESEEDDFLCSVCDCEFPMGTILYGCRSCDYDLCRECLAHTVFHASGKSFVTAFPEMQTTFQSYGTSNQSILQGTGEDIREATESESDSFASQQFFAEEALGGIEEEYGCLFWQVLLKKDKADDKYGFAQTNGRVEFEMLSGKGKNKFPGLPGPNCLVVKRIYKTGLLAKWNERVPQLEVKTGDRIVAVNEQNTVEEMAKEIHNPRIFLQVMRYPERFIVALNKENGVKLGFRFERPQGNFAEEVRITEVMETGALMTYNKTQVDLERYAFVVLPDMRIDRVNDVWGDAEHIAAELKSAVQVEIYVRRSEHGGTPSP